jgi:electron transfer flavoprotein alpha subunit
MTTLILADVNKGKLGDAVARAVTAATQLGAPVHILVATQGAQEAAAEATKLAGVEKVLVADDAAYAMAALVVSLAKNYSAIVSTATTTAKNIMPRVAALLDVMQISEIIKVVAPDTFERPIYAGNAIQTVQSTDAVKVITVRTTAFAAAASTGSAAIETIGAGDKPDLSSFKGEALTAARIIISGGRAMQNPENFKLLIEPVADKLGAAMGASRAAVDAGYAPNDWQVGQTGKVVAPELYIACGISGAIQHLAGMKDSKVIVAINKDEEAPIFQVADYGLVADLFKALPELDAELGKLGK